MSKASALITSLHETLVSLHSNPYPTLANPPNCSRRASVALIVRVRPSYTHEPSAGPTSDISSVHTNAPTHQQGQSYTERLESFFSQPWVQTGSPEILFIKRAARHGDRWTSHIALPGGKRDPEDPSDAATAERETFEEVGLDISASDSASALLAGPLPQRVVTTDFGAVPLMVLCPFVFLLLEPEAGRLRLQPAEVASAHWIPIAALLDPNARTYERADVVDRFASRWGKITRTLLGWSLGQALYAAVRLRPSESIYSMEEDIPWESPATTNQNLVSHIAEVLREDFQSGLVKWGLTGADPDPSRRLLLWGLTHGITCDFLGLLPAAKGLDWWRWPTLARADVRFAIWLVSYRFRRAKTAAVKAGKTEDRGPLVIIGEGLAVKSNETHRAGPAPATVYSAAGFLLDGYFEQIQRAVYVVLAVRVLLSSAGAWWLWKRYWHR